MKLNHLTDRQWHKPLLWPCFSWSVFSFFAVEEIVKCINKSLDDGTPEETHSLLQKPDGMLPTVLPRSAFLYHDGLYKAKQVRQSHQSILWKFCQSFIDKILVQSALSVLLLKLLYFTFLCPLLIIFSAIAQSLQHKTANV